MLVRELERSEMSPIRRPRQSTVGCRRHKSAGPVRQSIDDERGSGITDDLPEIHRCRIKDRHLDIGARNDTERVARHQTIKAGHRRGGMLKRERSSICSRNRLSILEPLVLNRLGGSRPPTQLDGRVASDGEPFRSNGPSGRQVRDGPGFDDRAVVPCRDKASSQEGDLPKPIRSQIGASGPVQQIDGGRNPSVFAGDDKHSFPIADAGGFKSTCPSKTSHLPVNPIGADHERIVLDTDKLARPKSQPRKTLPASPAQPR